MISGGIRSTATASSSSTRRLRRGHTMTSFACRIVSLVLLTTALTALLTLYIPYPLSISSDVSDPSDSLASSSNSTIHGVVTTREGSISVDSVVNVSVSPPPLATVMATPLVRRTSGSGNGVNVNSGGGDVKKTTRARRREPAYWRMSPDDQLIYAKKEIENAPEIAEDPDLYAPLFKNVSVFKRSYELMERILKVYMYRDGRRPIFHTPELRGIYASEGWFMKLMEENRRFVTQEPQKAHLFYLPYSSRQLENALYVPDSHDLKPLSIYLRDYVNWIAGKYPFWNRTRGSDHFLVACHDWGPYTTTAHEELCKNTIKALCNADTSEGIFMKGKDVSLPETTIRNPRRPLRYVGSGQPVSRRSILAFFAGNIHGRVRPVLLEHWDGKDPDMHIYGPLPDRVSRRMTYIQHMKTSKYCICPMGFEVNSPRIVEAIYYECVPVIIADNFVLPFEELLDWSAFSVILPEKDIPNLKNILLGISLRRYLKMHTCVKMLQKHFLWHPRPVKYDIFHMILHTIWYNRINQVQIEKEH